MKSLKVLKIAAAFVLVAMFFALMAILTLFLPVLFGIAFATVNFYGAWCMFIALCTGSIGIISLFVATYIHDFCEKK